MGTRPELKKVTAMVKVLPSKIYQIWYACSGRWNAGSDTPLTSFEEARLELPLASWLFPLQNLVRHFSQLGLTTSCAKYGQAKEILMRWPMCSSINSAYFIQRNLQSWLISLHGPWSMTLLKLGSCNNFMTFVIQQRGIQKDGYVWWLRHCIIYTAVKNKQKTPSMMGFWCKNSKSHSEITERHSIWSSYFSSQT